MICVRHIVLALVCPYMYTTHTSVAVGGGQVWVTGAHLWWRCCACRASMVDLAVPAAALCLYGSARAGAAAGGAAARPLHTTHLKTQETYNTVARRLVISDIYRQAEVRAILIIFVFCALYDIVSLLSRHRISEQRN